MQNTKLVYLNLMIISATIICFEIISTRISSVIFVNNYAFIILSFAILGLGVGGIFSHYKLGVEDVNASYKVIVNSTFFIGISLLIFITSIILLRITNPFVYFFLLIVPFFFAGIVYSQLYKLFAGLGFLIYASDLVGAAIGSIGSIFVLNQLGASNGVLFLSILIFTSVGIFAYGRIKKGRLLISFSILAALLSLLTLNGDTYLLGKITIGFFPEKDFYYVYPNAGNISRIKESRWSIYGRSDLVEYTNQDVVKQLFIDGSAGSQMYRFNGNPDKPGDLLGNLLVRHSTAIPFLFLDENEKNNMLVIGPGGGKEILTGLIEGVQSITGVEVNPDFVALVKKYKDFNGGIYTDFPNVDIQVAEGRHFIKQSTGKYDIICMALPSTEQLQSIDNIASNENFLLTVEAIRDYLNILTPEGSLIFTVHNRWELIRLIITTLEVFREIGIDLQQAANHFVVLGDDYAPTIMIKKNAFSPEKTDYIKESFSNMPEDIPAITFLPYNKINLKNTRENILLGKISENNFSLEEYISSDIYDISPVKDDSPYFYKINRGIPEEYFVLVVTILIVNLLFMTIPLAKQRNKVKDKKENVIYKSLFFFALIGTGFMTIEIALFQKILLYLGSPTISLSILLSCLTVGMGVGSYLGKKVITSDPRKKILIASSLIIILGLLTYLIYPVVLNMLFTTGILIRILVTSLFIIPFGLLLGIPFPTFILFLSENKREKYIPWMYAVNGTSSVLGSVLAIVVSMITGFSVSFILGLLFYLLILLILGRRSSLDVSGG